MNRLGAIGAAVLSSLFLAAGASASVYDPQPAFSGSNPSGVWSYGLIDKTTSLFTPFTTYSTDNNVSGVNVWSNASSPFPGIFNNTNSGLTTDYSTIDIPGNTLLLHPDNSSGDETDLRFTAPYNLIVSNIAATFAAASNSTPTTSDVHVYVNGVSQFSQNVTANAGGGTATYNSGSLTLFAGQTVEFRVGDQGNGYSFDGTTLVASITATPEPTSIALSAFGVVGLLARRRKA